MIININSDQEIEGFKNAGREAGRILDILISNVVEGITGIDLNNIALSECEKISACPIFLNYNGFPAAICVSKNSTLVHGIPDSKPFIYGDIISIDFGISIDGFIGDTAKTITVGVESWLQSDIVKDCEYALWRAILNAKSGCHLYEISDAIETVAAAKDFKIPEEYGGHGVSRNKMHSSPFVPNRHDESVDIILRKGMILAIEPMFIDGKDNNLLIDKDGWSVIANGNSSHFEHTIAITDNEPIVLTDYRGNYLSGKQFWE